MGQAKQRGTFDERQAAAYVRVDAGIEVRKKEIEQLEAFEKRQTEAMGNFVNGRILPQLERQYGALMRADFSKVELTVTPKAVADANKAD